LLKAATSLFETLGYKSDKRIVLIPNTAAQFRAMFDAHSQMNVDKALLSEWKSVDLLFQITDEEIQGAMQGQGQLFTKQKMDNTEINSYMFFAVGLKGNAYTRSQLATATREINKLFPMPVMVLFKYAKSLTLAIIARRINKRDASRDVLEKVTLIKDISTLSPHRAHIEILHDLSVRQLAAAYPFSNFVELQRAWEKTLDTSELNKKFYREVADWYFWAVRTVKFPEGEEKDIEKRNSTSVIRLITRLIFVWFIKEKGLVPEELFDPRRLKELLNYSDPKKSTYYKAIMQNLFFATLNTEMGEGRRFRGKNKNPSGLDSHHGISTVYRYEEYFKDSKAALALFADIPFLNGGLFECLDKREEKILVDGFSDDPHNQPVVPDVLFFGEEHTEDLSEIYGDMHRNHEKVRGLIHIFNNYKFTIEENTPVEEEIALDPELLGKVFENLLAAYNPETGTTARKQTGSFYTPREIVNYMVDEALVAYLEVKLEEAHDSQTRLRDLLAYNNKPHQFTDEEEQKLIVAIDSIKVLDPACGSGAFPMGILHKLVFILNKIDPGNVHWQEKQIAKAAEIPDTTVREHVIADIEQAFSQNELDYGRKLYLIENCIYGVDIQPIAVQIAKLRFFISLVVEQKTDPRKDNLGIRPLPNLETRFVAANTLIGIQRPQQLLLRNPEIDKKEHALADVRSSLFTAKTPATKRKYRDLDKQLRTELAALLQKDGWGSAAAAQLAGWDPYNQNAFGEFFDPEWMFGIEGGFDVVIGNPPYLDGRQISDDELKTYKKLFSSAEGKVNLFNLFIEKSLTLLKNSAINCFIVPSPLLRNSRYRSIRKLILDQTQIGFIVILSDMQFDSVVVESIVLGLIKQPLLHQNRKINIFLDLDSTPRNIIDQVKFKTIKDNRFLITITSDDLELLEKIGKRSVMLQDICQVRDGISTGFIPFPDVLLGKKINELFISNNGSEELFDGSSHKRVIDGGEFNKFTPIRWEQRFIKYDKKIEQNPKPPKGKPFNCQLRERDIFEASEKIISRQTSDRLIATLDTEQYFTRNSIHNISIIDNNIDIKYVLGVYNSKLLNFVYQKLTEEIGKVLPQVHIADLNELPIPKVGSQRQAPIINLVDRILTAKRENPAADTSTLEAEIDQLVYGLYGLTEEEISIVEGKA